MAVSWPPQCLNVNAPMFYTCFNTFMDSFQVTEEQGSGCVTEQKGLSDSSILQPGVIPSPLSCLNTFSVYLPFHAAGALRGRSKTKQV